jgi:hypothetical protein
VVEETDRQKETCNIASKNYSVSRKKYPPVSYMPVLYVPCKKRKKLKLMRSELYMNISSLKRPNISELIWCLDSTDVYGKLILSLKSVYISAR